jgi:hypothetical protein
MNLRKIANGRECMVRLPGICNRNPETVVLAHIRNQWFSRGSKPPDICGVWACSACHDVIDGRTQVWAWTPDQIDAMVLDALCRQLHEYAKEGIVKW